MVRDRAEAVLARVRDAGATGDLIVSEGESLSLKAKDGELEEHKVSSSLVFGLRVIRDDKVGTAYSEASDAAALESMVDQALANAGYARKEPDEKILPSDVELRTDDSILCPTDDVPIEAKIEFALRLERELAAKSKVRNVPYNGVRDMIASRRIFNTAGLSAYTRSRVCSCSAYALVEDGEANVMDGMGQTARRFAELDVANVVTEAHGRCLGLLHGKAIASKHYDVIFDADNQVSVFGVFAMMFSGKSAKDGVNPMRDRVGEMIADERLSLLDSPDRAEGFGYALFDDEGSPAKRTPLIVNGRLTTLAHSSATATHFGLTTTGHARRSPKSTLDVGLHQMEIAPGDAAAGTLLGGEYLHLTDLSGLHSGANAISGDFSFGASGYLCRDGERTQPIRNITVAGNFYQMLKKIAHVGDVQLWNIARSAYMPPIRFADVAISG